MFRTIVTNILIHFLLLSTTLNGLVLPEDYPFSPAADEPGSTAVARDDERIEAWASGYLDIRYGTHVDEAWQTPERALGTANGSAMDIVSLGRGGAITLSFDRSVNDGPGPDFAVFENAHSDDFLELAWVEVSTDGVHFVRFPDYSATADPVGAFGSVDPRRVHGYAGKYRQGYGTPFDLAGLAEAHALVQAGNDPFSDAFRQQLLANFPLIDIGDIRYIRLVDVVGDGSATSAIRMPDGGGYPVFDPFPTVGSAGFDLEAVAVLNSREDSPGSPQHIFVEPVPNQLAGASGIVVRAYASSGLPVVLEIHDAPVGSRIDPVTHLFEAPESKGTVILRASQPGNETHAPAEDLYVSFDITGPGDAAAPLPLDAWLNGSRPGAPVVSGAPNPVGDALELLLTVNRRAAARIHVQVSRDMQSWETAVPEVRSLAPASLNGDPAQRLLLRLPPDDTTSFWRVLISSSGVKARLR